MNKVPGLLKQRGMTEKSLMWAAKLDWRTIKKVTRSKDWPDDNAPIGTVKAIAKALGVSPGDLITENNKEAD